MHIRAFSITLLVLLAVTKTSVAAAAEWGAFGYVPGNIDGGDFRVTIQQAGANWAFTRTEHHVQPDGQGGTREFNVVRYADLKSCPVIQGRMALLPAMIKPDIVLPPQPGDGSVIVQAVVKDAASAYLEAPVAYGADHVWGNRIRIRNVARGPVLDWVMSTTTAMESCWSEVKPWP